MADPGTKTGVIDNHERLMKTKNRMFILDPNSSGMQKSMKLGSRRFYKAVTFLKKHCYEPIGVEDLTRASKLSRRGLHKAFQKHMGHGPGRELRRIRIERARDLLVNSDHGLKIIARMCGYRSKNSFWVSFREVLGESPGRFRSRFRGRFVRNGMPLAKSKIESYF